VVASNVFPLFQLRTITTKTKVKPIPKGYSTITPFIVVKEASKAIEFYKKAFMATEMSVFKDPTNGKIAHAEVKIGNSYILMADEFPQNKSPKTLGGTPVTFCLYVEDVDTFTKRAVEAGAKITRPVENQFYGDRSGTLEDPFGHIWTVSTHIEDVSHEEMMKRMSKANVN